MQITIDSNDITLEQFNGIAALLGFGEAEATTPAPAAKAPARKTAAKKAAPAKAAEPDEDEEAEDEDGPTLEDCIARAQELVGEKRTQEVKDAVAEIGVERVSKLKNKAQFVKFLELVADDADDAI